MAVNRLFWVIIFAKNKVIRNFQGLLYKIYLHIHDLQASFSSSKCFRMWLLRPNRELRIDKRQKQGLYSYRHPGADLILGFSQFRDFNHTDPVWPQAKSWQKQYVLWESMAWLATHCLAFTFNQRLFKMKHCLHSFHTSL